MSLRLVLRLGKFLVFALAGCARSPAQAPVAQPVAPMFCHAVRELLIDGDFEASTLSSWHETSGHGRLIERSTPLCQDGMQLGSARRGRRAFSSSASDGAAGREILLTQHISLAERGLMVGTPVSASVFAFAGCEEQPHAGAQLFVEFMRGGPGGEMLAQVAPPGAVLRAGSYQQITTPPALIPAGTDTIVLLFRSATDRAHPSIELWADDLSLAVCGHPTEPLLVSWQPIQAPALPREIIKAPPPGSTASWDGRSTVTLPPDPVAELARRQQKERAAHGGAPQTDVVPSGTPSTGAQNPAVASPTPAPSVHDGLEPVVEERVPSCNIKRADWKNRSYGAQRYIDGTVARDGVPQPDACDWVSDTTYGDLTGDGKPEAVVTTSEGGCDAIGIPWTTRTYHLYTL